MNQVIIFVWVLETVNKDIKNNSIKVAAMGSRATGKESLWESLWESCKNPARILLRLCPVITDIRDQTRG